MTSGETVHVRLAREDDIEGAARLIGLLFEQEEEFGPDADAQRRGIEAQLATPDRAWVFVAELGSRLVGIATLQLVVSTAIGAPVGILEDMVIHPGTRGQGVGGVLLTSLLEHATRLGCRRITLLSDGVNIAGHRFYERHGFVVSSMVAMRLDLPR